MPRRILRAIGNLKPWKPTKSLPSYSEPTPETSRKLSREEEAEIALKNTAFTPAAVVILIAVFVATLGVVPLLQLLAEVRAPNPSGLSISNIFKVLPTAAKLSAVRTVADVWSLLPRADELKSAEKTIENESVVAQRLLPAVQSILTGGLGAGNEQVYVGRDCWLFYRPDVDYVTGPPFLDPVQLKRRAQSANVAADSIAAIVQFRDQLAARGIDLVLVPAPAKPSLQAEKLTSRIRPNQLLQNASFDEWKSRLTSAGVRVFDPAPLLAARKSSEPLYLRTDTHWRPQTMQAVAAELAASLRVVPNPNLVPPRLMPMPVEAVGDIARMLKLPADQTLYPPEKTTIQQVAVGSGAWRSSPDADILLLGDSFANIFSLEGLGWGESAGFAEHLSAALGGRPLDCILRNSDGAFATREILARELARGRDRLAGKQLVIWEFAARELAFGNWKLIELKLGQAGAAQFFFLPPGGPVEATGTVEAVSLVPRPATVPYRDHVMSVLLTDLKIGGRSPNESLQAVVYLLSMRDNVWTPAARLRVGDRVSLRLRAWADVTAEYEGINRSEIDDPAVQLEEPCWGEL
ncbi:MAG: hypothetical protein M3Y69_01720, partial [Verrucomicrobiota bacterium]|nr:hypothetical protein [Verrucomicrobiota bacterium]